MQRAIGYPAARTTPHPDAADYRGFSGSGVASRCFDSIAEQSDM
jgi:hypothetical protein